MIQLEHQHPDVYHAFKNGFFVGKKSEKRFSFIALDQIHEQENVKIKTSGGVTPLLKKESAFKRWLLSAPELTNIIEDFEQQQEFIKADLKDYHHDEGIKRQLQFKKDVKQLTDAWEAHGNPFEEEISNLVNVFDRSVVSEEVCECIFSLEKLDGNNMKNT